MRILLACELSAVVRDAFRARGHAAISCDLEATEGDPRFHIQADVLSVLDRGWDLMIGFPPCTALAVSGARYWKAKQADGSQAAALAFVRALLEAPIPRIAVENPIGRISTAIRKPDQIIQPWQYGDPESKATCLWLKNLPRLTPTNILTPRTDSGRWNNQTPSGQNKLGPSADRAQRRARTYAGIARAMAAQWSLDLSQRDPMCIRRADCKCLSCSAERLSALDQIKRG